MNERKNAVFQTMHHEYFHYSEDLKKEYGEKSVVLLQCGGFFEVYGLKDPTTNETLGSSIVDVAKLFGFIVTEKKVSMMYNGKQMNILMAGLPMYSLDKNIPKLVNNGYTVALYVQEKEGKNITRRLEQIYSQGTFLSNDVNSSDSLSNNTMCIWVERHKQFSKKNKKDIFVYGASVLNVFSGELYMIENELPYEMMITTFDELERFTATYNPNEVIFIYDHSDDDISKNISKIVQYSGIITDNVHFISTNDKNVEKCKTQVYAKEIITSVYDINLYESCSEFTQYVLATQSMCYLIDFIQRHNARLIEKIKPPQFNNISTNIILANHTLTQLNILYNGQHKTNTKLSSVLSFLNSCKTSIGRRLFEYYLTHPSNDIEWLKNEYQVMDAVMNEKNNGVEDIRKILGNVRDTEKMFRQLVMGIMSPHMIYLFYESIVYFKEVVMKIKNKKVFSYLGVENFTKKNNKIMNLLDGLLNFVDTNLEIDRCKNINSLTSLSETIIQRGLDTDLDSICDTLAQYNENLYNIKDFFNKELLSNENSESFVKLHETDKKGMSLRTTKTRAERIKAQLRVYSKECIEKLNGLDPTKIEFIKVTANEIEIREPVITNTCRSIERYTLLRNEKIVETYKEVLKELEREHCKEINELGVYIGKVDVLYNKVYLSKKYNYVKPNIDENESKSYFDAKSIRHCLIERIQEDEIYVTNDVSLGKDEQDGILLYGTNAVGKTSLIRSIGVTLIMAQSGMYVPCSEFTYKPYNAIFSRILGNDNLFKGLSTFAVEMSELRTILNLCDENSLILGDELCSGTEIDSALSIFVSGLDYLTTKRSSFIFATHFHEVVAFDEITEMQNLHLKHLEVVFDHEKDCLVYDRKLKEGSGPRTYGLEVCKSLYMKNEFIEKAFQLRNKYFPDNKSILENTTTKYNTAKVKGKCEICKKVMGTEIHHLQEQQAADENGFITHFHKNHKANIVSICKKCHDDITYKRVDGPKEKKRTSAGLKLL